MKTSIISLCVRLALLLLVVPTVVFATTLPFEILLESEETLAVNGQTYHNRLRVDLPEGGTLGNISLTGNDWTLVSLDQPPASEQLPGTVIYLNFSVIPTDSEQPLTFTTTWNNNISDAIYHLGVHSWRRANQALGITVTDMNSLPPPGGHIYPPNSMLPLGDGAKSDLISTITNNPDKTRTITVRGRFVYYRQPPGLDGTIDLIRVGAYGFTVDIYDDGPIGRTLLAETITDGGGYFSTSFSWPEGSLDPNPDIYVIYRASNSAVETRPHGFLSANYRWQTDTHDNYSGTNLDIGTGWPADSDDRVILHIHSNICRTFSWFDVRGVEPGDPVVVRYPSRDFAMYVSGTQTIHITDDYAPSESLAWQEPMLAHEYGHHWMHFHEIDNPGFGGYCNTGGYFDDSDGCGHGQWCDENEDVTWDEGVPDWIADVSGRSYMEDWGFNTIFISPAEDISICTQSSPPGFGDPTLTEGLLHAFLYDVVDDDYDDLTSYVTGYADELNTSSIDAEDILNLLVTNTPHSPSAFIADFRDTYNLDQDFWQTARYAGYTNIDNVSPDRVLSVNSSSHTIGISSPDDTIDLNWVRAADDFSGTAAYSILISGAIGLPDDIPEIESIGNPIFYSTDVLAPGTYFISVRTQDRAGNWSTGYRYNGPFTIAARSPADVTYGRNLGAGQQGPLVLRSDQTATGPFIQWSSTLPGDTGPIYWNIITSNLGDEDITDTFLNPPYLDGELLSLTGVSIPSLTGLTNHHELNWNLTPAIVIPAGRHLLSIRYDASGIGLAENISESDETNNRYGIQRVFIPPVMTPSVLGTRVAPPISNGGHNDFLIPNPIAWENQDGLRFTTGNTFDAVVIWAQDSSDDYNCTLDHLATNTTDGFRGSLIFNLPAHSQRGPGLLDAVITNGFSALAEPGWDVGVIRKAAPNVSDYNYIQVNDAPLTLDAEETIVLDATERMILRRVNITAPDMGWKAITLTSDPAAGPLHVAWYYKSFSYGPLEAYTDYTVTDDHGDANLDILADGTGRYLVAVWRDPIEDPAAKLASLTFGLTVETSLPDLVLEDPPTTWYSPLVPRPDTAGTPEVVFGPTILAGEMPLTYININAYNQGKTSALGVGAELQLDGATLVSVPLGNCGGESNVTLNMVTPVTIPGGRHTLSVNLDPSDSIAEASEINNRFAEQYIWGPVPLSLGGLTTRTAPRGPVAGWDAITTLRGPLTFNCDGVSIDPPPSAWFGIASLPQAGTDVDLRLHEVTASAKDGFNDPLAVSGWGPGQLDFVLVNTSSTPIRPFDVGILGISGTGTYQLDAAESDYLDISPGGPFGPFTMSADELLNLYKVNMSVGFYVISLDSDSGVDLGFSLHSNDVPFGSRSQPMDDGVSFIEQTADHQSIVIGIETAGEYCLAVWRRHAPIPATDVLAYDLSFSSPTDVPELNPEYTATRIGQVYPSPFNPRLNIVIEVAQQEMVVVDIYDLSGKRIRTLQSGLLSAGNHQMVWEGKNERGSIVSAGVYLVRLKGDKSLSYRKVTLIK